MNHGFSIALCLAGLLASLGCGCAGRTSGGKSGAAATIPGDELADLSDEQIEERVKAFAHFAAGVSSELNENPKAALDHYLQSATADPGHEDLVVDLARRLLASKETEKAIELLEKATAAPGASGRTFALLGLACAEAGRMDEAARADREAIRRSPDLLNGYRNLVALLLDARRSTEALAVLDEAAARTNQDPGFWMDLAELYAGYTRQRPGEEAEAVKKKAVAALDRAASLKPQHLLQIQKLADGYKLLGELAKAAPLYVELMDRFPALPGTRESLADIYLRLDEKEKAAGLFEAISRDNPGNPQPYYVLAMLAYQEKRYEDAADYFQRALTVNPDFEPTYYDLAGMKIVINKPADALAVLARARERFKQSFIMEYSTARAHARAKNYSDALRYFTEAEVIGRAAEPARLNHVFYFEYGAALERSTNHTEAEKYFRKCLELSPNFSEAMNYLGYMWTERGENLDEAKKLITRAVELEPDNAAYLDSMAWVLFKLKQPREALGWMEKALKHIEEPDATLFDHLGDIHQELGDREQAIAAWQKALEIEPNDQIKAKLDPPKPAGRPGP